MPGPDPAGRGAEHVHGCSPAIRAAARIDGFGEPQGVLYLSEFNRIYVANGGANRVDILDGTSLARTKSVESQQVQAEENAAKTCKAERTQDPDAFKAKYGTNKNKSNAFGKCVSQHAKTQEKQDGTQS